MRRHDEQLVQTPVGALRLEATEDALTGAFWQAPERISTSTRSAVSHPLLEMAMRQLQEYFAGERIRFDLPLQPEGTAFQRAVWEALTTIPYGETRSYSELALQVGRPRAMRAVGHANGSNPLSIFIPCHRVIGANGTLTGYAGGLTAKQWLLMHERQAGFPCAAGKEELKLSSSV